MEHGGYNVFTRTWWRNNPAYPNGLEPSPGRKRYLARGISYERARQLCHEYNSTHKPSPLSRKAEFETASLASDLQRQAKAMIASGTMPSLETVLKAVAESRAECRGAILQARSETLELNDHDRHFLNEMGIEIPEDAHWPLDGDSADPEAAL